jgi:hypothetical protein
LFGLYSMCVCFLGLCACCACAAVVFLFFLDAYLPLARSSRPRVPPCINQHSFYLSRAFILLILLVSHSVVPFSSSNQMSIEIDRVHHTGKWSAEEEALFKEGLRLYREVRPTK